MTEARDSCRRVMDCIQRVAVTVTGSVGPSDCRHEDRPPDRIREAVESNNEIGENFRSSAANRTLRFALRWHSTSHFKRIKQSGGDLPASKRSIAQLA